MLFLRREDKWDEVGHADMFFSLRNHLEWQKDCGVNLSPQDPLVLALKKDQRDKLPQQKQCCLACSIGERCLKLERENTREDRLEDYVSPVTPSTPPTSPPAPLQGAEGPGRRMKSQMRETGNQGKRRLGDLLR